GPSAWRPCSSVSRPAAPPSGSSSQPAWASSEASHPPGGPRACAWSTRSIARDGRDRGGAAPEPGGAPPGAPRAGAGPPDAPASRLGCGWRGARGARARRRAPRRGVILAKLKEVGEIAVPGGFAGSGDLIRMANLHDLRGQVDVTESELAKVHMGQRAELVPDAYPDRRYRAHVVKLYPQV